MLVAIKYPEPPGKATDWTPQGWHIDGMHTADNGVAKGRVHPVCLLVGIALSGSDAPFTGNFGYFPQSHMLLETGCRTHPKGPRALVDDGAEDLTVHDRLKKLIDYSTYRI